MSSSSGKKIVRKVFYSTGSALGKVEKLTEGLVDIAKSFQAGYHLLGSESQGAKNGNGKPSRPSGQQLEGLYGYLGKLISENIANKNLSVEFDNAYEFLQKKAEDLLNEISSIARPEPLVKTIEDSPRVTANPREDVLIKDEIIKVQSEDTLSRLKGVVQLSRSNTAQARKELLSYSKDPDSLIRRVIVNCINPEGGDDETFAIVKFINDPDEDVARIAIRKSAKIRNRLGFTYLISKLESQNVKLRQEAINALVIITGSDLGFNPEASESNRQEAIKRWQKIWQDNQTNTRFLIDDEATKTIAKRAYADKRVALEKDEPVEKKPKASKEPKGSEE